MFLLWATSLLVFYGLPYYFSTVLRAESSSMYCNASVYIISLDMCGVSMFEFKFFLNIYRYMKQSRTWNMFLFLVMWQEFKSLSYECFFQLFKCRLSRFYCIILVAKTWWPLNGFPPNFYSMTSHLNTMFPWNFKPFHCDITELWKNR